MVVWAYGHEVRMKERERERERVRETERSEEGYQDKTMKKLSGSSIRKSKKKEKSKRLRKIKRLAYNIVLWNRFYRGLLDVLKQKR